MFSILTHVSHCVRFALDSVAFLAQGATYAGFFLTSILLSLWSFFLNSAAQLGQGISIVVEDFFLFISEAFDWILETLTLFVETTATCILGLGSIPGKICSWLVSLLVFIKNNTPSLLSQSVNLLIDSIVLIGLCVYDIGSYIIKVLIFLNEIPHVAILLFAKQLDNWIAGSSDWAKSRFLKATLGVAFIYSLVLIDVRFKVHDKLIDFSSDCSVALIRSLKQIIRITLEIVVASAGTMCRLGAVAVDGAAKFSRRRPPRDLPNEFSEKLCIICLDRSRNIVLLNCRHLCLCGPCSDIVALDGTCPICRTRISSTIKIYS